MDISVIIVNYKSRHLLKKCLSSLSKNISSASWEAIIVNNDEEKLTESFLQKDTIKILNTNSNLGFAKGCNEGSKISSGKILFFLNPDTELQEIDLNNIFSKLQDGQIGIVAPKIFLSNGTLQPWSAGKKLTFWNLIKTKLKIYPDLSTEDTCDFDWVSGAGFLITKNLFERLNGFDEKFFMYFEDMDLCLRTQNLGLQIKRLDDFTLLHQGGKSYDDKKLQKTHYYVSQDYYFKKHFGLTTSFLVQIIRKFFLIFN